MQINATLIGQAIAFLILIWFSWKVIWPPLTSAIDARQKKIADGLAAADRGQKDLEDAKSQALAIVREAHGKRDDRQCGICVTTRRKYGRACNK